MGETMMQFPVSVTLGSTRIMLHAICEVLAFSLAFRYYLYLRRKKGDSITGNNRIWIIIGAIMGALIGSRLIGGLENTDGIRASDWLQHFYYNRTVVGGFLGGLAGVEAMKKLIGEKKSSGDLFTFPMILGLVIGRIGCFGNGIYEETYGLPTHSFLGMDLGDNVSRHPVTLYEIAFLAVLWIAIRWIEKKWELQDGGRFKIFMIAYLLFRFFLDFIKPHQDIMIGLSTIQLTCLAGLLYYGRYFVQPRRLFQVQVQPV